MQATHSDHAHHHEGHQHIDYDGDHLDINKDLAHTCDVKEQLILKLQ